MQTSVWRKLLKFLVISFIQLKKTKEIAELSGRKKNHHVPFCKAKICQRAIGVQEQICCCRQWDAQEEHGTAAPVAVPSSRNGEG